MDCVSYDLVNSGSSLPEASLVIGEKRMMRLFILHSRGVSSVCRWNKEKRSVIALWGCLMFSRFKKADDNGMMPHPWYSNYSFIYCTNILVLLIIKLEVCCYSKV